MTKSNEALFKPDDNGIHNMLLRHLPKDDVKALLPLLRPVDMNIRETIHASDQEIEYVYFVESGIISMISTLEDGTRVEVGMAGFEGMIGLPALFGTNTSSWEAMVQVNGRALRMSVESFRKALGQLPALMRVMLRYVDAFQAHITQSAACNARHQLEQRLAKWLLTVHDRVDGDQFLMTQEFMAIMLGSRRPGVTQAIGALQKAGLVRHGKGSLLVLDRANLEKVSCECYRVVRNRYSWLFDEIPR